MYKLPIRRTLLLSYPRSGNSWVRYCVETLSKKKTIKALVPPYNTTDGMDKLVSMGMSPMDKDSLTDTEYDEIILEKSHIWEEEFDYIFNQENNSKLILIIRDYKECIPRNTNYDSHKYSVESEKFNSNLIIFDNTNIDKLLIYYEDLILQPKETLIKILKFLDEYNEMDLNTFIEKLPEHKKNSISVYNKFQKSFTEGKDLNTHKSKLNQTDLNYLDSLFTNKLLNRYK